MKYSVCKILGLVISLSAGGAFAATDEIVTCEDQTHRYVLTFPITDTQISYVNYIDRFERDNIDLFCGRMTDVADRIEIACVNGHMSRGMQPTIRVRTHRIVDPAMPRVALLEIQKTIEPGSINDIIPLVCDR